MLVYTIASLADPETDYLTAQQEMTTASTQLGLAKSPGAWRHAPLWTAVTVILLCFAVVRTQDDWQTEFERGKILDAGGNEREAEEAWRKALKLAKVGTIHYALTASYLGCLLIRHDAYPEAERLLTDSLQITTSRYGGKSWPTAEGMYELGVLYLRMKQPLKAKPFLDCALQQVSDSGKVSALAGEIQHAPGLYYRDMGDKTYFTLYGEGPWSQENLRLHGWMKMEPLRGDRT